MKKLTRIGIAAAALSLVAATAWAGRTYKGFDVVTVRVNGKELSPDVPAIVMDGRTLVPARAVAEAIGYKVNYDEQNQTVYVYDPALVPPGPGQPARTPSPTSISGIGEIILASNDEDFVVEVNGAWLIAEAKTYCFNYYKGDSVLVSADYASGRMVKSNTDACEFWTEKVK